MKKIILVVVIMALGGGYVLGAHDGAERSASTLVGKLRENCITGTHYTTLDKEWELRCMKIQHD